MSVSGVRGYLAEKTAGRPGWIEIREKEKTEEKTVEK